MRSTRTVGRARSILVISAKQGRNGPCGPVSAARAIRRGGERSRLSANRLTGDRRDALSLNYYKRLMIIDIAIIVFLIFLNGVFAMTELAVVSSRKNRLGAKAEGATGRRESLWI